LDGADAVTDDLGRRHEDGLDEHALTLDRYPSGGTPAEIRTTRQAGELFPALAYVREDSALWAGPIPT